MSYTLMPLPYSYDALEPYLDAQTMEIHYSKHHQGYVNNLNKALEQNPELAAKSPEKLLSDLNAIPENIRASVRNQGGGVANHNLFWQVLKPDVNFSGPAADKAAEAFSGYEGFKEQFSKVAVGQFGSGWAWLVMNGDKLEIMATANQDSPLSLGKTPILGIDVWEHAYYLKYQNRRPEYIEAFFKVINWDKVNELYEQAGR